MKTTLNKLKEHLFFEDGLKKLLTFLNKSEADDEELSLLTILESNGFYDALWALLSVEGYEKKIRLMACDFAESVVHLSKDERSANAIKVARDYANGLATLEELKAAEAAAWDAYIANNGDAAFSAWAAYWAAAWAAAKTADAATWVNGVAGWVSTRADDREKQIEIFKKYVK
jgi:hypothetical protein